MDDQVLLRFSPKNSDSIYYFSDLQIGGTTFFHEKGSRRCLKVSITFLETIGQRFVHPSRRNSSTITKAIIKSSLKLRNSTIDLLDQTDAHPTMKDLDFSKDGKFLARFSDFVDSLIIANIQILYDAAMQGEKGCIVCVFNPDEDTNRLNDSGPLKVKEMNKRFMSAVLRGKDWEFPLLPLDRGICRSTNTILKFEVETIGILDFDKQPVDGTHSFDLVLDPEPKSFGPGPKQT